MATRRAHNKSRLGCHQCKRRRIKCDNKQPSCANCDKKNEVCSFLMLAPSSRLSITATSPGVQRSTPSKSPEASCSPKPSSSWVQIDSNIIQALSPSSAKSATVSASNDLILASQPSPNQVFYFEDDTVLNLNSPHLLPYSEPSPSYFKSPTISPYLRFDDAWKDIREVLSPSLQDILQHYEYTTSLIPATDDAAKAAWQSSIPTMAMSHEFLVNCVLSVAALHLGRLRESPSEKEKMTCIAASRMNKALIDYRKALSNVTEDNAGALFASSTLTAVYLFRTSILDMQYLRASVANGTLTSEKEVANKMMSCVMRTVWGLRGPLAVLTSGWNHVVNGAMHSVITRKWWPQTLTPATPQAEAEDTLLKEIENLWLHSARAGSPQAEHLTQALSVLRECFALVSQLTLPGEFQPVAAVPYSVDDMNIGQLSDRGAIFVWSARISRDYIQLIEAHDRDALVVLAHYAVLPGRVRNVWWLEGLGADFVTAIALAIGRDNWPLIEWPASVVRVDLENALAGGRRDMLEGSVSELCMDVI